MMTGKIRDIQDVVAAEEAEEMTENRVTVAGKNVVGDIAVGRTLVLMATATHDEIMTVGGKIAEGLRGGLHHRDIALQGLTPGHARSRGPSLPKTRRNQTSHPQDYWPLQRRQLNMGMGLKQY